MALHQVLCGVTMVILLSTRGSCQRTESPKPKCGMAVRNTRIIGGQDSSPGSWPWQVDLQKKGFGHYCGGTLINDQWVLTAAHCLENETAEEIVVFLGGHSQFFSNPNEIYRAVNKVECHPYYGQTPFDNDICLLELSSPVVFDDYIQPICLASAESEFYTGTKSWVTGWGATGNDSYSDILQEVRVPIVGNKECGCIYADILTENMICAGARERNACQGDSGGPLVSKYDGVWIQSGVVSFGTVCGEDLVGYTRVSQYEYWISNITGNSSLPGFVTFNSFGVDHDLNSTCPTGGGSIFDSGENLIRFSHFTHFFSLGGFLVLSFYALV